MKNGYWVIQINTGERGEKALYLSFARLCYRPALVGSPGRASRFDSEGAAQAASEFFYDRAWPSDDTYSQKHLYSREVRWIKPKGRKP